MATTVTPLTAARATSSTATPSIPIPIAATAAGPSLARTFRTPDTCFYRRYDSIHTVEVRLVIGVEVRAALDHGGRCPA